MPKHVTTCFPINTQGKRVIKKEMLGCHPLCPSHIRLMPSELGFPGHICGFWVPKFPPFPSWHSWQLSVIWENFKSLSSYLRLGLKSTATEAMPIRRAYPEFCVMDGGWHFFFSSIKSWTSTTITSSATSEKCFNKQWISWCKSRCSSFMFAQSKIHTSYFRKLDVRGPPQSIFRLDVSSSQLAFLQVEHTPANPAQPLTLPKWLVQYPSSVHLLLLLLSPGMSCLSISICQEPTCSPKLHLKETIYPKCPLVSPVTSNQTLSLKPIVCVWGSCGKHHIHGFSQMWATGGQGWGLVPEIPALVQGLAYSRVSTCWLLLNPPLGPNSAC